MTYVELLAEWSSAELNWVPVEDLRLASMGKECETIPCDIDVSWDEDC